MPSIFDIRPPMPFSIRQISTPLPPPAQSTVRVTTVQTTSGSAPMPASVVYAQGLSRKSSLTLVHVRADIATMETERQQIQNSVRNNLKNYFKGLMRFVGDNRQQLDDLRARETKIMAQPAGPSRDLLVVDLRQRQGAFALPLLGFRNHFIVSTAPHFARLEILSNQIDQANAYGRRLGLGQDRIYR